MSKKTSSQLDKILALVDSAHDGEALSAIRMARQILARDGMSFADLAKGAAPKPRMNFPLGFFSGQHIVNLEAEILQLRTEIDDLRDQKNAHEANAEMWQKRAIELEQKLNATQSDAVRWRQLAQDTIESLRDLGTGMDDGEPLPEIDAGAEKTIKSA